MTSRILFFAFYFFLLFRQPALAQDTFSIVALDSSSREVGSAGASCLDLVFAQIEEADFLTRLIPDTGAVNIQSYFIQLNQDNAVARLRAGDNAQQVINWLVANDPLQNPEFKQHGVVSFNGSQPSAASHTGSTCLDYKNHITGSIQGFYYAIQGNILKGQMVLDSMEKGFRNTSGSLACRLMAAMQGAKMPGADARCLQEGISSKFAFLQVARKTDVFGFPSWRLRVKLSGVVTKEPIDSLQSLFDDVINCTVSHQNPIQHPESNQLFPNPFSNELQFAELRGKEKTGVWSLWNGEGKQVDQIANPAAGFRWNLTHLPAGLYSIRFISSDGKVSSVQQLVKL